MVKELYPIIDEEGIALDAKIDSISNVGQGLDEIKINKPGLRLKIRQLSNDSGWIVDKDNPWGDWKEWFDQEDRVVANAYLYKNYAYLTRRGVDNSVESLEKLKDILTSRGIPNQMAVHYAIPVIKVPSKYYDLIEPTSLNLNEAISPESRRRIINAITQGAALRGTFAFYLFKEHLDELDPTLVEKYNQIMKNSFGIYDDENAIAMMLAALAQGHKDAGGSSKVIINEIKVVNPTQFVNYREASLNYLKHLKNQHFQDSNFLEPNHPIIKAIESSQSEDELDKIMIKNLFMDDDGEYDKEDYQKTKDLIKRKYSKINEIKVNNPSLL